MGAAVTALPAVPAGAADVPVAAPTVSVGVAEKTERAKAPKVRIGAAGEIVSLRKRIRSTLARHSYARFASNVPKGRMITVGADQRWSKVAAMRPGSPLYRDVVRWARVIKHRPGNVLLAYSHEPETSGNQGKGNAREFKQAFRKVVTVFRSQRVRNVKYTWQMTAWSFRTSRADRIYAAKWYPGNKYVDIVGADAYNWYNCGEGRDKWMQLSALTMPVLAFARSHGKRAALPEFASNAGDRRANWLKRAHRFLESHRLLMAAAFYFHRPPTNPRNAECRWRLSTRAEFSAYRAIARDRADFRR